MYGLIFLLWLVLNAGISREIIFTGIGLTVIIGVLAAVLWGYTPKKEWKLLTVLPLLFAYGAVLLWNVITANMEMKGFILHKNRPTEPAIVELESGLSSRFCRYLLSESITLTPGTITVRVEEGHLWIHAMVPSMVDGTDSRIMDILRKVEAKL